MNPFRRWRSRRARIEAERAEMERLLKAAFKDWYPVERPAPRDSEAGE